jgi:serine/threonine protein kinase
MERVRTGKWKFRSPVWNSISPEAKDFVSKLLTFNPAERPTAQEILSHKWLQRHMELNVSADEVYLALLAM